MMMDDKSPDLKFPLPPVPTIRGSEDFRQLTFSDLLEMHPVTTVSLTPAIRITGITSAQITNTAKD